MDGVPPLEGRVWCASSLVCLPGGGGGGGLVCFPWRRGSGVPSLLNVILIVIMTEHACLGRTEGQLSQVIASHINTGSMDSAR